MTAPLPASQTLSRGIRILEELADSGDPLTIEDLAARLGLHRSVLYRLVRTLEDHGLVVRDASGRARLGARLATLAAGVAPDLQAEALPELTTAANDLGMTCFLVVLDRDECVTLSSVEPRHSAASVIQRPGSRHPVTAGAPGKAILSQLPASDTPENLRAEIAAVGRDGYATSHDEVIASVHAVAVPLVLRGRAPAAVAAVYIASGHEPASIAQRLARSATAIQEALNG